MEFIRRPNVRQFNYIPKFFKPAEQDRENGQIRFERKTLYNPHARTGMPVKLLLLLLVVIGFLLWADGVKPRVTTPEIKVQDVVRK